MAWNHILLEGYCFFNSERNKAKEVPTYCKNGPGKLGLHCIAGCGKSNTRCPHFSFGEARSTVVVTDEKGEDFACNGFAVEDATRLTDSEYLEKEKSWITSWSKKINESRFEGEVDMRGESYSIWIESETCQPNDIKDDNTDVIVEFCDGTRFFATFFTYDNINSLVNKNRKTGENLSGKYFWSSDMILVDEVSRERIEEVVNHLIQTNEFIEIFRSY